ncbi:porin [Burkholderia ubonensis]|uniref:porin n=1 Tax=Burkholderia ubonensis TaxID=101571 RepID=UPI000B2B2372|nr:porin [Burkholderia ubonensis]
MKILLNIGRRLPPSIATIAALSGAAHAQSTVTLYGIVDNGIVYTHNSGGKSTQVGLNSGSLSGSRWGLKGAEDLGGGLKAIFQVENGVNLNTGKMNQGGRLFGRQSYVGLKSSTFGTLTAGRVYDPLTDLVQPIQGDGYLGQTFTSPGDVDNADSSARFNNAVKWTSPTRAGFTGSLMYGFGGVAGSVASGQAYSAALAFNAGHATVAGGYLHVDRGNPSVSSRGTSSADTLFNSSVNAAYSSAKSIDIYRIAAQYQFATVTLGAYYSDSRYAADASSTFRHTEVYRNASVFGVWMPAPTLQTEISYNYLKSSGDSSAHYHQVSLGADYLLSKRTDIYAILGYTHAAGRNGTGEAQAVIGATDIDAGRASQVRVNLGIRHRF